MPCIRYYGCLALGAHGAKEIDGLVVSIILPDGQYEVSRSDIKGAVDEACDMKLFQGHFAALFYLRFILIVLLVLQFIGCACAATLKLNLCAENPFVVEFIITSHYEARNANSVAVFSRIAFWVAVKTIGAIILECSYHFAVASHAQFVPTAVLQAVLTLLSHGACSQYKGDGERNGS